MPKVLATLTPEEMVKRKPGVPKGELLAPYVDIVSQVPTGGGMRIELEEGENQRAVKRRITTAAKALDKRIKWRSAPEGQLEFQVLEPKPEPVDGEVKPKSSRSKKPRGGEQSAPAA